MFKIKRFNGNYCIANFNSDGHDYLHSDGKIYRDAAEYWPTNVDAQAVLDRFCPKHGIIKNGRLWKHGDVFRSFKNGELMMLTIIENARLEKTCNVFYLPNRVGYVRCSKTPIDEYLDKGVFLYNISEKL